MRNRLQLIGCLAVALLLGLEGKLLAGSAPADIRRHFVLSDSSGSCGVVTEITRMVTKDDEDADLISYLFESATGERLIVENNLYYAKSQYELRIRDVRGDSQVTVRFLLPFPGQTRRAFLAETRRNAQLFEYLPDEFTIETRGGTWSGSRTEWEKAPRRLELTSEIRRTIPFELLEAIERAKSTLFASNLAGLVRVQLVDFLIYRHACEPGAVKAAPSLPDCQFDERFGFRCSEAQNKVVKEAVEALAIPDVY
jgi:hypothetical protein